MIVLLSYDTPETRHQNFLRQEFTKQGARRVQYSLYLYKGEPHECDRVVRYMRRVASGIPGDIRLIPMEEGVWERQIVISEVEETQRQLAEIERSVIFW
jgi:CRISPR-associated endonuclease Cas2